MAKTKKSKIEKGRKENKTIKDYIARHGKEKGIRIQRNKLSNVVVNGKTMTCAQRDNLVLHLHKKHYTKNWIAQAFNVHMRTIQKIIEDKG